MITGEVDRFLDARIPLSIVSAEGTDHSIAAVIDTGFNGFLTLPPNLIDELHAYFIAYGRVILADGEEKLVQIYEITLLWDGEPITVETDAADTEPLVGMAMMDGYKLEIAVQASGTVTLKKM